MFWEEAAGTWEQWESQERVGDSFVGTTNFQGSEASWAFGDVLVRAELPTDNRISSDDQRYLFF